MLNEPLTIKRLTLRNRTILAPLAGVSDIPFRRICRELGAGLTYVEMLAARPVIYGHPRNALTWARDPAEDVLGVQLTGASADDVGQAAAILQKEGFDTIDINMGCPVKKAVKKGWGSAILKEPERIFDTIRAVQDCTSVPVSAKIRTGWDQSSVNVESSASHIGKSDADMITIHGRTREDRYDVPCDLAAIRRGFTAAKNAAHRDIVCVANGDILDEHSASKTMQDTEADAVMISRGALGNPWIFRELLTGERRVTLAEWQDVLFRHMDYHESHHTNRHHAAITFRKHLLWYISGFPGTRRMREELSVVDTCDDARTIIRAYVKNHSRAMLRYENTLTREEKRSHTFNPSDELDRPTDRVSAE